MTGHGHLSRRVVKVASPPGDRTGRASKRKDHRARTPRTSPGRRHPRRRRRHPLYGGPRRRRAHLGPGRHAGPPPRRPGHADDSDATSAPEVSGSPSVAVSMRPERTYEVRCFPPVNSALCAGPEPPVWCRVAQAGEPVTPERMAGQGEGVPWQENSGEERSMMRQRPRMRCGRDPRRLVSHEERQEHGRSWRRPLVHAVLVASTASLVAELSGYALTWVAPAA